MRYLKLSFIYIIILFLINSIDSINIVKANNSINTIEESNLSDDKLNKIDFNENKKIVESNTREELKHLYEYDEWVLQHRKITYQLTFISTIVIFFGIFIIVGFGLYISYIQFAHVIINNKENTLDVDLEINRQGIKVSSSIVGVIILLISLIFFYLYIKEIYPINHIQIPHMIMETPNEEETK